jgi:hypothetical protein
MAVLIEAISVVIRAEALLRTFPGGWEGFKSRVPNQTLCADNEIVRVGFMSPQDVESFVKLLTRSGLTYLKDGQAIDVAVADQIHGLAAPCSWLEFGHVNLGGDPKQHVAACRLVNSKYPQVVTPPDWTFDGSLSHTYGFVPSEHTDKSLKYLRHENGLDVYLSTLTGQEVYIGRTGET